MWLGASFRRSEPRKDFLWRKKEIAHPSPWSLFQPQGVIPARDGGEPGCLSEACPTWGQLTADFSAVRSISVVPVCNHFGGGWGSRALLAHVPGGAVAAFQLWALLPVGQELEQHGSAHLSPWGVSGPVFVNRACLWSQTVTGPVLGAGVLHLWVPCSPRPCGTGHQHPREPAARLRLPRASGQLRC